ncbi:MAG: 5'/3'-nucleotidase SurE [Vampirovibrionales bacterium]|nr:5'/3'-nucleotidase SurE [Vampirovibrionales bacterium]
MDPFAVLRILISNDDGIFATGLNTLAEHLAREFEVFVVAPDRERSATGHALTLHKPLRVDSVDMSRIGVKSAFAVTGTPSDCVKIGLSVLLEKPVDVVISGINHGPNVGADVLYSGTVSAAIEGAIYDLPSLAVSMLNGHSHHADFTPAAEWVARLLKHLFNDAKNPCPIAPKTVYNINVPALPLADILGVRVTHLGTRMFTDSYEKRVDPRGGLYYWLAGERIEESDDPLSDVATVRNNYVSLTPIQFDLTHHTLLESVRGQIEHLTFSPTC